MDGARLGGGDRTEHGCSQAASVRSRPPACSSFPVALAEPWRLMRRRPPRRAAPGAARAHARPPWRPAASAPARRAAFRERAPCRSRQARGRQALIHSSPVGPYSAVLGRPAATRSALAHPVTSPVLRAPAVLTRPRRFCASPGVVPPAFSALVASPPNAGLGPSARLPCPVPCSPPRSIRVHRTRRRPPRRYDFDQMGKSK